MPALGVALLPEQDQALVDVQVLQAQGEGSAAAAGGFGVHAQEQGVEGGVVAGGGGGVVDLAEFVGG